MQHRIIPIAQLQPHPGNSNVMPKHLFAKLVAHIRKSGRYPPIIVRPLTDDGQDDATERFEILDGHHRVRALEKLKITDAYCVAWPVDDDEAMLLMATLNRLEGHENPGKRAALVQTLSGRMSSDTLAKLLPDSKRMIEQLAALSAPAPRPQAPTPLERLPVAVHFFLLPHQRDALERKLKATGQSRETALLQQFDIESDP